MSAAAMSALLISIHGVVWGFAGVGGVEIVGLTGRTTGGGLSVGFSAATLRRWVSSLRCGDEAALRLSGMRSTTVPLDVFWPGGGMIPRVMRMSKSARLIASARPNPDSRRLTGARSYGEGRR